MRRLFVLVALAIVVGGVAASAQLRTHARAAGARVGLDAASGAQEADALAAVTPGTFSGSFSATSCGTNAIAVPDGSTSIQVVVTATIPTNDIALTLSDPSGSSVASSDVATSPEAVTYSASSIPAGNWTAKICPSSNPLVTFVDPTTYSGAYTISSIPLPPTPAVPTAGTPAGSAGTPKPTFADGKLSFSPETIVDPQRTEGEPVNFFAPDGSYWESGPFGTTTQQSWVHRSTDNGLEFHELSPLGVRPDLPPGGGDTDVVVDDQGFAYFLDLEALTNVSTSVSNDGGNTWRKQALAAQEAGVDRPWYAMDNGATAAASDNTVFLAYRQVPTGSQILSSPGSTGGTDGVGGLVWTNAASPGATVSNGAPCGKLVFDPVHRNLYLPCGQSGANSTDHIELVVGHVDPGQRTGIQFKSYELPASPGGGNVNTVFPWVAADKAGNLMAVWIDGKDRQVYETVSTDQGKTWTAPVKVNTGAARTNVFPEVAGGDAGTFAIAWYGSDSSQSSDAQPANTDPAAAAFPWYGYVAVVTQATTQAPTIAQQRFTEHPMHYGLVCNSGTTCTSGRTMADYFDVGYDRNGAIRFVFDDESSQYRQAHLMEVRQLAGAEPKSPMSDPTGDAHVPQYAPATGPGPNLPQMDFTRLALSQPEKGVLRVQMTLAGLASLTPPAGKSSIVWLTRFQALSTSQYGQAYRIFYVGAKSTAGGTPTFFAGSGDDPTGCLSSSSGCKIVTYPAEQTLTSGSVADGTITIDVSLDKGFGTGPDRTVNGSDLYSVTALSYGENADADLYAEGDATHSFDYSLGGVPPAVAQPTSPPGGNGAGNGGGKGGGKGGVKGGHHTKGLHTIRGIGVVHVLGRKGTARFTVAYGHGAFMLDWRQPGLRLRGTGVRLARFKSRAGRLQGTARVNGKRVRFVLLAVDRGVKNDLLRLAWAGGATHGGALIRGSVTVP